MASYPLLLRAMIERPARYFGEVEVVSRAADGSRVRRSYAELYARARRLAAALPSLGVGRGDRVATIAWNHVRHLELYFGIPCAGAVLHTVNLRLPAEHLAYVLNHAGDRVVFVDEDLLPLVAAVRDRLTTVQRVVPLGEAYERLLAEAPDVADPFPADLGEEEPAAMCYTSATTGEPKGVVYSHRALFLHCLAACAADMVGVGMADVVLPVVPMFHVNAWGLPYAAAWVGARQVLPGPRPDPRVLCELIAAERVTVAAGVPTVWLGVQQLLEREGDVHDLRSLRCIICGGSAPPPSLIAFWEERGVHLLHAYGMTEAAPLTHVSRPKPGLDEAARRATALKQGLLAPGLEMRVVGEDGRDCPPDGQSRGELWLRGAWVAQGYHSDPRSADTFRDGWYRTGDVVTVDAAGYIQVVDRLKDIIKSGGEWISSIELENALMGHPAVQEAAVIGVPHPRWQERPLACVVCKPGREAEATPEALREALRGRFPDWWLPDAFVFVAELPKTGTGKFDKKALRARFAAG